MSSKGQNQSKTWEVRRQDYRWNWQAWLQNHLPDETFGKLTEREGRLMQIAERVGYERGYSRAYHAAYIRKPPKDAA